MENQDQLKETFSRYIRNECSPQEVKELLRYFETAENGQKLRNLIAETLDEHSLEAKSPEIQAVYDRVFNRINLEIESREEKPAVPMYKRAARWAAAASIVLALSIAAYRYIPADWPVLGMLSSNGNDVAPGGSRATLTLADGSSIVLDDLSNGVLASQGNTAISKTKKGQIIFDASDLSPKKKAGTVSEFNTIATPRGGEYRIILPDGTKVWLNAASSLRFPTAFAGDERYVELTGEAYFEVAPNPEKPFKIASMGQIVEVLGTHFNVTAYEEEGSVKTTLLEGSVKISPKESSRTYLLKPGQQSSMGRKGRLKVVEVDTDEAVAWKNGYFQFHRDNIQEIMRILSRWYDVEVVYKGRMPRDEYVGRIRRSVTLSQALEMLKITEVKFKIEGRKIIVKG